MESKEKNNNISDFSNIQKAQEHKEILVKKKDNGGTLKL